MRCKSSTEPNSTTILPLRLPRLTVTRVSNALESCSATSWRPGIWIASGRHRLTRLAPIGECDRLFGGPHRQSLGDDPRGKRLLRLRSGLQRQQRSGVPGRQHAGRDPALDRDRQAQQPDHVGDQRARPTDPGGEFFVGDIELVEQLLVGRRLFQRVQLRSVDVFQEGVTQQIVVGRFSHDRGDSGQACRLGRAPAPLPHDELIARSARRVECADHDRLHEAELADRVHEFGERFVVEHLTRLARVRLDQSRINFAVHRADVGRGAGGCGSAEHHVGGCSTESRPVRCWVLATLGRPGGDQRSQASPEAAFSTRRLAHRRSPSSAAGRPRSASSRPASR
jgi:hypothetical protein